MRKPTFSKSPPGRQVSQTYSLPAPVGGWNTRDSAANMAETDAMEIINYFPETNDIRVRKGTKEHVTDIASNAEVESLMTYNNPDGTETLFCAASDSFYDVTTAGSAGAAVVGSLSNARWQHVNFTNSSGTSYLCTFNGIDSPQFWDNSSWTAITGVSTPAITGLTTSDIINCAVHKRRMWLVTINSLKAFYLPVDSVGGKARAIDLGGIATKGGYLMAIGTWTLDAGEGADDYWAAITSEGQVIVYIGTDPTSSSTWSLKGVWDIGEPIGRRCLKKFNGDLLIITVNGVIPLSRLVVSASTDPNVAITEKINKSMTDASANYRANFGWEIHHFPQADMLLVNIPVSEGRDQEQYAMNTITSSWGRFKNIDANCWAILEKNSYYGGSGRVYRFWNDLDDNGADIDADLRQAESYFGAKGQLKYFKSLRPVLSASGTPSVLSGINVDYQTSLLTGPLSFSPISVGLWDIGLWDAAIWGGDLVLFNDWQTFSIMGTSGAFRLKSSSAGIEVRLQSSDHVFEYGGIIA